MKIPKCPKCSSKMFYKRLTVDEFNSKFLITIAECKACRHWIQDLDLQISRMATAGLDFTYRDENLYVLPESVKDRFLSKENIEGLTNRIDKTSSGIIQRLVSKKHGSFESYADIL